MPSAIVETPSKGDLINAPIGADPRTAASVRTPLQSIGNRLKFLENFYDAIKAFALGGTVSPAAAVSMVADFSATALRGRRRMRIHQVPDTAGVTVNAASEIDLVYVDRTVLSGACAVVLEDTGWANGDVIHVVIRNSVGGRNVSLTLPGESPTNFGDTTNYYLALVRLGVSNWDYLSVGDDG